MFHSSGVTFWLAVCSALAFAGIGLVAIRPFPSSPSLSVPDNVPAVLNGCVVDPALVAADREHFTVELAPGARAQVSLFAKPDQTFPELPYGTVIEFTGKVRRPHNYNNPGAFDAVHYFARQRIYWNASADAATVHILPGQCGNSFAHAIFALRMVCLERLDHLYAGDAYSNGMMQAVLIGATAKLDRMWTEDYRSTGTFHALVISGGHVAVLAVVLLFFLRLCAVPNSLALFLTLVVAWVYAGITGWQAPVLRSAAGMTLFAVGRCFYREGRLLNILAAVALIFIAIDPEQLIDASFELSFLAVALIGAFVVPALEHTSAPLSRGLTALDDPRRDMRIDPKSAQFRIELRLLADTLHMVLRLPERAARWIVLLCARVGLYLWEIFVTSFLHSGGSGAADDLLFPSRLGFGAFGKRHRGAVAERGGASGIPCHRVPVARAGRGLRVAARGIARGGGLSRALGARVAYSGHRPSGWRRHSWLRWSWRRLRTQSTLGQVAGLGGGFRGAGCNRHAPVRASGRGGQV